MMNGWRGEGSLCPCFAYKQGCERLKGLRNQGPLREQGHTVACHVSSVQLMSFFEADSLSLSLCTFRRPNSLSFGHYYSTVVLMSVSQNVRAAATDGGRIIVPWLCRVCFSTRSIDGEMELLLHYAATVLLFPLLWVLSPFVGTVMYCTCISECYGPICSGVQQQGKHAGGLEGWRARFTEQLELYLHMSCRVLRFMCCC